MIKMVNYQKHIIVVKDDLDELDHVNNVRYVQWIQDISKEHWQQIAPAEEQNKMIWVVRNHNITYYQSAQLHDEIVVTTSVISWKGAISIRQVNMKRKADGKLLVEAKTEWCALGTKTLRPVRVPEALQKLFIESS